MVGMMRRGEVWVGNLNPNRGAEVGKIRPVVVLQSDRVSSLGINTVIVLPTTTQVREVLRPLRVTIPARDRLRRTCQVMVDQPRTLDRQRFGTGPLTTLTAEEMATVERRLLAVMGVVTG